MMRGVIRCPHIDIAHQLFVPFCHKHLLMGVLQLHLREVCPVDMGHEVKERTDLPLIRDRFLQKHDETREIGSRGRADNHQSRLCTSCGWKSSCTSAST